MSLKIFGGLAPLVLGGLYVGGALGGGGGVHVVDRPPAAVMAALADLDIRRQPGNPGTDPSRSGGVTPVFRTERTPNSITWTVISRDQVAMRMTAVLEPIEDGRSTRISTSVERGDAPDEIVSPAFRSAGLTFALFDSAVTDELNELTAPPPASAADCDALREQITMDNLTAGSADRPEDLRQAVRGTIQNIERIRQMEARLRQAGCTDTARRAGDPMRPVSNRMGNGGGPTASRGGGGGANFEPGRPMVDASRDGR